MFHNSFQIPQQQLSRNNWSINFYWARVVIEANFIATIRPAHDGSWRVDTGSFSKDVFSQGAEYQVFLGVFLMFLAFFHSKIWAKFHFGTFKPYD